MMSASDVIARPNMPALAGGLAAWAGGVALLSASGALAIFDGLMVAPVILLTIALPVLLYAVSATVRASVERLGLQGLTALHVLRVAGAAWIFWLGSVGKMPPLLVSFAGWGDVIAALVATFALTMPFARWRYIVAHIVSLADFAASLTVGLWLTVTAPVSMAGVTGFPVALILFFIIGFYSANSIICLNALVRGRTMQAPPLRALEHRIPPPLLAMGIAVAMGGLALLSPAPAFPFVARAALAAVFFVGAGVFGFPAFVAFAKAGTTVSPVQIDRSSALVTSGIYRITRNPMYVSLALLLCALTAWLGLPLGALGPAAFVAFVTRFQIIPEERALSARFGSAYDAYRQSVRRWL
jgi:protein-S-isoprenylcysteine O-methyltransferase Ste14